VATRAWVCVTAVVLAGCSRPPAAPPPSQETTAPARITQFYATLPQLARGEKELLCYGVENAKTVWLSPPRRELSAALSRCVDVDPTGTTTYTLTAEGPGGSVSKQVTVTLGAAKAKIIEVRVSALDVKAGNPVSICYKVANAKSVHIEPRTSPSSTSPNCGIDNPKRTTTYTVTAVGAGGDQDQEHVTVKVH
jgi:hypothetical protein